MIKMVYEYISYVDAKNYNFKLMALLVNSLYVATLILLYMAISELQSSGFYTLLRVVVTATSVLGVILELEKEYAPNALIFAAVAVLFNPILPVYLHDRDPWVIIDIIFGIFLLLRFPTFVSDWYRKN